MHKREPGVSDAVVANKKSESFGSPAEINAAPSPRPVTGRGMQSLARHWKIPSSDAPVSRPYCWRMNRSPSFCLPSNNLLTEAEWYPEPCWEGSLRKVAPHGRKHRREWELLPDGKCTEQKQPMFPGMMWLTSLYIGPQWSPPPGVHMLMPTFYQG